ncbi:cupin domain-containing protein, partial [Streptomyces sp. NPDC047081]|uniref:cupin domain-containing protein n=1 Tax=Streptomyces sp. NPDC047081 TaxID=3154706 RepID=UPI0033FCEB7E
MLVTTSGTAAATTSLERSRARGVAFSHATARGEWGVRRPTGAELAIHGALGGEAFLWTTEPSSSRHVLSGDIVLVRGPSEQFMAHAPGADVVPLLDLPVSNPPGGTRHMGSDNPTTFFCDAYTFQGDLCAALLAGLPPRCAGTAGPAGQPARRDPGAGVARTARRRRTGRARLVPRDGRP